MLWIARIARHAAQDKRNLSAAVSEPKRTKVTPFHGVWLDTQRACILKYTCPPSTWSCDVAVQTLTISSRAMSALLTASVWCRGEVEDWPSVSLMENKATVGALLPGPAKQQWLV